MATSATAAIRKKSGALLADHTPDVDVPNRLIGTGLVSFGRNANQEYHAWRHVDEIGLDRMIVQNAVLDDVPANLPDGFSSRIINVIGINLEYRIFKLLDGTYNIGTIFEVKK